uniref:POTRA domain-containing protein n=1 Tax=Sebdenia flabellata TaxID=42024 RepID=A0A1C9C9T4_9FLOR|nr:hypothetical protein Sebd_055 [Sebdenia flabellata]AOM65142.1 hypothetical protein Sebd_055 [Sebdenia flabellata]
MLLFIFIFNCNDFINIHNQKQNKNNYILAFNVNQFHQINYTDKQIKIKKIRLENCNKFLMKKLYVNNPKFQSKAIKNLRKPKEIKHLVRYIRKSGFFYYIKIYDLSNEYSKYFMINSKVNPVIKKIYITNYSQLQIPVNFLKQIFETQLGMPRNYNAINKSVQKIKSWYEKRGFQWAHIRIARQKNLNTLSINISEGEIKKIHLVCQTKHLFNKKFIDYLNYLIEKEMGIFPGHIFNLKKIELGLLRLKYFYFVEDCSYTVNFNDQGLNLTIYYNLLENCKGSFYNRHVVVENYKQYQKILNLLNFNIKITDILGIIYRYIQQLNIYYDLISLKQKLETRYNYLHNKKNIYYLQLNTKIEKQLQKIDIVFYKHFLSLKNKRNIFGTLIVALCNNTSKYLFFRPFIFTKINNIYYKQISNLILKSYTIQLTFRHSLVNSLYVIEHLFIKQCLSHKINFHIKDYSFRRYIKRKFFIKKRLYNLQKVSQLIENKISYIEIAVKYNGLYLQDYIQLGKSLEIQSKLFTIIKPSTYHYWDRFKYLSQLITSKYIHAFSFPRIFPYIYNNILTIVIEVNFLINQKTFWYSLKEDYYKNSYLKHSLKQNIPLYSFYLLHLEYHMYKFKYCSIYCFCNFISYLSNKKEHLQLINNYNISNINRNYKGLGFKLDIPIKKLPNIRLEYLINNLNESFIQLRTNSKYI